MYSHTSQRHKKSMSAQETSAVKLRLLASRGGSEGLNTEILEWPCLKESGRYIAAGERTPPGALEYGDARDRNF